MGDTRTTFVFASGRTNLATVFSIVSGIYAKVITGRTSIENAQSETESAADEEWDITLMVTVRIPIAN